MMFFDPVYFVYVGPAMLLAIFAQVWVKRAFTKWSRVAIRQRLTGREVALRVLAHAGIQNVTVEEARGFFSDHYDPRHRTLRLSPKVANEASVAACAVAAHEVGHAIQHARRWAPLQLRSAAVPAASIGSNLSIPMIFLGMFLRSPSLLLFGTILFAAVVLFQIITLPVEFDASRRAKKVLAETGMGATGEEAAGVAAVHTVAAMTYVAATIQAVAQLLYYLTLSRRS